MEFGQPPLYENGHGGEKSEHKRVKLGSTPPDGATEDPFHISVGWSSNEPADSLLAQTAEVWTPEFEEMALHVDRVKVKLGNVVRSFQLAD